MKAVYRPELLFLEQRPAGTIFQLDFVDTSLIQSKGLGAFSKALAEAKREL